MRRRNCMQHAKPNIRKTLSKSKKNDLQSTAKHEVYHLFKFILKELG